MHLIKAGLLLGVAAMIYASISGQAEGKVARPNDERLSNYQPHASCATEDADPSFRVRPIVGGSVLCFSTTATSSEGDLGSCTAGIPLQVRIRGKAAVAIVTAAHCFDSLVAGSPIYQYRIAVEADAIGSQFLSPPPTRCSDFRPWRIELAPSGTPRGLPASGMCAQADAVLLLLAAKDSVLPWSVHSDFRVLVTQGDSASKRAVSVGVGTSLPEIGTSVWSLGVTSGFVRKAVASSCKTYKVKEIIMPCLFEVSSPSQGGDSGGPVLLIRNTPKEGSRDAILTGIVTGHTACKSNPCRGLISPWQSIVAHLAGAGVAVERPQSIPPQ